MISMFLVDGETDLVVECQYMKVRDCNELEEKRFKKWKSFEMNKLKQGKTGTEIQRFEIMENLFREGVHI